MVLLTSGQVQVALSSAIVCAFTFALFLAGYTLQQKSIDSLHTAIRPRAPSPRHNSQPQVVVVHPETHQESRFSQPLRRIRDSLQWRQQSTASESFDWSRLAFAQLVRDHSELCNALIIFSDLHRLKSPAPRLLLFPQHWVEETDSDAPNPFVDTSRRLLKKASRRYRVTLVPIQPNVEGKDKDDSEAYSTAAFAMLHQQRRVMTFPPPGLILDAKPLDSILAFSEVDSVAAYSLTNSTDTSTLVIVPSTSAQEILREQSSVSSSIEALLPDSQDQTLFTTSQALRDADPATFNATDFLDTTAYVHFADTEVPGPEYDIPYSTIVKMRPSGDDQSFLWEKMYSTFKDRRYGVCGLDLEVWPPTPKVEHGSHRDEKGGGRIDL